VRKADEDIACDAISWPEGWPVARRNQCSNCYTNFALARAPVDQTNAVPVTTIGPPHATALSPLIFTISSQ